MKHPLNVLRKLRSARTYVHDHGLWGFAQELHASAYDRAFEKHLGIHTCAEPQESGDSEVHVDHLNYVPISYAAMVPVLHQAGISRSTHLVDYGCGAGRVLGAGARANVASATGVEFQPRLAARARANVELLQPRFSSRLHVVESDAALFSLPDATTMVFFIDPSWEIRSGQLSARSKHPSTVGGVH